jgi:hypothetical protein
MPIGVPQGNLDIKNATLRTSNLETQNIKIGSIFVGTGNSLEETANVGNSMSNTIQFTNTHTAFTTTGNVSVGKDLTVSGNVTASTFSDGTAQLTGGTWSGSAASLTTAVDIGGVAFDGSASIVPTTFGAATFSGDVTVATNTLHIDATNNRVGVGTSTPGQKLSIYTGSTSTPALSFDRYATDNYRTDIYQNAYGPDFRVGYSTHTPESILYLKRLSDGSKEIEMNGKVGIGNSTPYLTLDVHASARPSAYPFAIGGSWSNRANYVAFTVYPGNNLTGFSKDVQLGGGMRPHWCRVLAGAATSGSHTLQYAMYAEFIINTWGTNVSSSQRSGDSTITISSNGNDNSFRVTISGGVNGSYPRAWIEVYSENGVYW